MFVYCNSTRLSNLILSCVRNIYMKGWLFLELCLSTDTSHILLLHSDGLNIIWAYEVI